MGHNITAFRQGFSNSNATDFESIEEYFDNYVIAYIRRGATDNLNQAIYIALGLMELYEGTNGNGKTVDVSKQQLQDAREILNKNDFSELYRDLNVVDRLKDFVNSPTVSPEAESALSEWMPEVLGQVQVGVVRELEFVEKCIEYLNSVNAETIDIKFS